MTKRVTFKRSLLVIFCLVKTCFVTSPPKRAQNFTGHPNFYIFPSCVTQLTFESYSNGQSAKKQVLSFARAALHHLTQSAPTTLVED